MALDAVVSAATPAMNPPRMARRDSSLEARTTTAHRAARVGTGAAGVREEKIKRYDAVIS